MLQYNGIREIVWAGLMKRSRKTMDSSNQQLLIAAIREVWRQVDQDYFRSQKISMVRDADGGSHSRLGRSSAEVLPVPSCMLIFSMHRRT